MWEVLMDICTRCGEHRRARFGLLSHLADMTWSVGSPLDAEARSGGDNAEKPSYNKAAITRYAGAITYVSKTVDSCD
jgi:hypothetical protein